MSKLRESQSIFCADYRAASWGVAPRLLTRKMGKTSLCLCHVYQCVFLCVNEIHSWVLPYKKKSVISESAQRDETLGSHSHYFEAAISHCCDGENLIVLLTRNALIV